MNAYSAVAKKAESFPAQSRQTSCKHMIDRNEISVWSFPLSSSSRYASLRKGASQTCELAYGGVSMLYDAIRTASLPANTRAIGYKYGSIGECHVHKSLQMEYLICALQSTCIDLS